MASIAGYYQGNIQSKICGPRWVGVVFQPNGSSAIVAAEQWKFGASAAYSTTGTFIITFDEVHRRLLDWHIAKRATTPTGDCIDLTTIDLSSAKTATIVNMVEDGSPAAGDIAHDAATFVHAWFLFGDSITD